ncbi:MAG TPA: DUF5690 family protein [Bacteriovoracaceae bacterium]|nr:DUF5690 family protein [Bacteriovoracaceae bacterium]
MKKVTLWLEKSSQASFALYCLFFSFSTYFCVYAFRKPFSVGTFEGKIFLPAIGHIDFKILLIISQVMGYALSKFIGIKFVSEVSRKKRGFIIAGMIILAEVCLILFPLIPKPYNSICLFLNGIPLGMIWGLVYSYLEGRKLSDLFGPGLSASFIIGSGAVKSAGKWILEQGLPEIWMPAVTGALFLPLTLFCVLMLDQIPSPSKEEEILRTKRKPMDAKERWNFFTTFAPGILSLTVLYVVISAYKDFRDNFARELWDGLGYQGDTAIFTTNEMPIALVVLFALGGIAFIKGNRRSFNTIFAIMFFGSIMIGCFTFLFESGLIGPEMWMMGIGMGLYLAYVPFGCMLYDNLIGMTHFVGTAGMMIYVSDAFGYLGSVGVMLYKNFCQPDLEWVAFFIKFSYFTSIFCVVCFALSYLYFTGHKTFQNQVTLEPYGNA